LSKERGWEVTSAPVASDAVDERRKALCRITFLEQPLDAG
jgi:hypothetical protein